MMPNKDTSSECASKALNKLFKQKYVPPPKTPWYIKIIRYFFP
jgi:hypothetical protein